MERKTIRAVLRATGTLNASMSPFGTLSASVRYVNMTGGKPYDGTYTITPALTSQTMPTAGRLMRQDVTVLGVPYEEISNKTGGITAIIGG